MTYGKLCARLYEEGQMDKCRVLKVTPRSQGVVNLLPLSDIKVGMTVFIKEKIVEYANEHSPGGVLAKRGEAVVVGDITIFVDDAFRARTDEEATTCNLRIRFGVHHPWITDGRMFSVSREEIMVTDPLVTILEQREWLLHSGYKHLDERFRTGDKK